MSECAFLGVCDNYDVHGTAVTLSITTLLFKNIECAQLNPVLFFFFILLKHHNSWLYLIIRGQFFAIANTRHNIVHLDYIILCIKFGSCGNLSIF